MAKKIKMRVPAHFEVMEDGRVLDRRMDIAWDTQRGWFALAWDDIEWACSQHDRRPDGVSNLAVDFVQGALIVYYALWRMGEIEIEGIDRAQLEAEIAGIEAACEAGTCSCPDEWKRGQS